jgi:hypothetical protein
LSPFKIQQQEIKTSNEWIVSIETSKTENTDTMDSNVFIYFNGDKETQRIWLRSPINGKTPFKPGALDEFKLNFDDIGKIKSIRIGFDNSGFSHKWHINYVTVKRVESDEIYKFSHNSWLVRDKSEEETEIVLNLNELSSKSPEPITVNLIPELNLKKVETNDSNDDFDSKPTAENKSINLEAESMLINSRKFEVLL